MKTLIHTHSWEERAQRRPRTKNKRNVISLDTTNSCTRCALNNSKKFHFHRSHDVTETPRDMQTCRPTPRPLGPSAQGKELINKGKLNFKTVRKWLHCLLTLLGERVKGRQEKSRKERWCQLTVPYMTRHSERAIKEHKPLHGSFLGPSTQERSSFELAVVLKIT